LEAASMRFTLHCVDRFDKSLTYSTQC
jgi:hypothetical protein